MFARICVGAAPWGSTNALGHRTALTAWNAIPAVHRRSGTPRAGSLVYFEKPSVADSRDAGHVVLMSEGGYCYSNDILRPGKIDRVPLSLIVSKWGMRQLGWTAWTPSGAINLKPVIAQKPPPPPYLRPIGYGCTDRAQVLAVQHCLNKAGYRVPMSGTYIQGKDVAMRAAIGGKEIGYAHSHPAAFKADGSTPGVVKGAMYKSLMTYWY